MTLGRGAGHSPKMRSEEDWEDDLGSSDVVGLGSEAEGRSDSLPSVLEDTEDVAAFLGAFFLRLILLLKWSLCEGSWGPLLPGPLLNSSRSSAVGTHSMAWSSGLPLDSNDRRTHTRLVPCAARKDVAAERSRGGASPTRHGL